MSELIRSWKDPDSTSAAANPAGEIDLAAELGQRVPGVVQRHRRQGHLHGQCHRGLLLRGAP
jgi:hypothetical protein